MTKIHELSQLGQSIWLDYIRRSLITSGELQDLIDKGLRGITSNPTIFDKAISESDDYNNQLRELVGGDTPTQQIYEALAIRDIQDAADVLRPVYEETDGLDGYVSLEANPHLAYDTEATIQEIRRLHRAVNRPNVMFKVPATSQGIPAIEQLISEGININITLMFSMDHYENVANAYLSGLEKLHDAGGDISQIASVASFFVSRVDVKLDERFEEMEHEELKGKIGIANSKNVYLRFKEILGSDRWQRLAERGARIQRVLWGSTSTKNPNYPDTLYIDNLIGPHTVNTVPPGTLEAFLDHGTVALTLEENLDEVAVQLEQLEELGIDLIEVGGELQKEGVEKFIKPFDDLMQTIEEQREQLQEA